VGAFGIVALVRRETGGDDFKNFTGLWSRSPLLSGCMAVFMLSLAGLPPLAGFFGKFYLFSAALRSGQNQGLLWLVALALLGSFISLYYYLAVLKAIFVDAPETGTQNVEPLNSINLDFLQRVSLTLLAGAVLALGLLPGSLVALIAAALAPLP
jgi:NADH-quinone oxidoreductase subunit N